jgi:energy-coupling factor transporter transmembrane protein EcfT
MTFHLKFHDLLWLMDTEDAYVDWMMEVRQRFIPSIKTEVKEIPCGAENRGYIYSQSNFNN